MSDHLHGQMDRSRLIISASIALAVYFILDLIDPYIALPLRENSAKIAAVILNAVSVTVSREGTILSTPNFRMDVEPACSGSTTLRILMTACVIWSFLCPGLTPWRRFVCIVLSVPIAVISNGFRVAGLVGGGDILLKPIEGLPHYAIGAVTFTFAMLAIYLLSLALAVRSPTQARGKSRPFLWLALALGFLYLPVGVWISSSWTTSMAEWIGAVFFAAAGANAWRTTRGRWRLAPAFGAGFGAFTFAMLAYVGACFVDVRTLQAWTMLLGFATLTWALAGWRTMAVIAPSLVAFGMGFPMTSHVLEAGFSRLFQLDISAWALGIRMVVAAGSIGFAWLLAKQFPEPPAETLAPADPALLKRRIPAVALVTVIGILGQGYLYNQANDADASAQLELSYLQGDWVGVDNPVSEVAAAVIGRQRITSRRYTKGDEWVEIIITSTGADRRRAHPPEACMQGTGWVAQRQALVSKNVSGREVEVNYFRFKRGEREVDFVYWFTDGTSVYPTYNQMLNEDLLRRARGERVNWFLVRVLGEPEAASLDDFLGGFGGKVVRVVALNLYTLGGKRAQDQLGLVAVVPEPATVLAGALLLAPVALGALRRLRRSRAG